jgi:Zn-finger nucleic acid-binding protein
MYRETARSCPACASPMREVELRLRDGGSTGIDLCDSCGGVFLEFFDGEPVALSRRLLPALHPTRPDAPSLGAELRCPDCRTPMVEQPYLHRGPHIARCESCMSVFATRAQLQELAGFRIPEDGGAQPTWADAMAGRLAGMFRSSPEGDDER